MRVLKAETRWWWPKPAGAVGSALGEEHGDVGADVAGPVQQLRVGGGAVRQPIGHPQRGGSVAAAAAEASTCMRPGSRAVERYIQNSLTRADIMRDVLEYAEKPVLGNDWTEKLETCCRTVGHLLLQVDIVEEVAARLSPEQVQRLWRSPDTEDASRKHFP